MNKIKINKDLEIVDFLIRKFKFINLIIFLSLFSCSKNNNDFESYPDITLNKEFLGVTLLSWGFNI